MGNQLGSRTVFNVGTGQFNSPIEMPVIMQQSFLSWNLTENLNNEERNIYENRVP